MERSGADGTAQSAAATAIFLWVAVAGGLAYGLVNTLAKVVHLFGG
jgi:hypothetical protein